MTLLLTKDSVNAKSKDNNDRTPMWWATRKKRDTVVKLLNSCYIFSYQLNVRR